MKPSRFGGVVAGLVALGGSWACGQEDSVKPGIVDDPNLLTDLIGGHCEACDQVLADPERWRVQCLISEVEETGGRLTMSRRGYRLGAEYFYPASSIKTCGAIAALKKMRDLQAEGWKIDLDTKLIYHPLFEGETIEDADETNLDGGAIMLGHDIRKLAIVSDNQAFNHLYEFVGHRELNEAMWAAGLDSVRITHRLDEIRSEEEHRRLPRIAVVGAGDDGADREIPERTSDLVPPTPDVPRLLVGEKHMTFDDELIDGPMDFSRKNYISVEDLQNMLVLLIAPEMAQDLGLKRFLLAAADRAFLLEAMAIYPRQSENPKYDPEEYSDKYCKFFLPGLREVASDSQFHYYNKVGWAYGFATDNACIVHEPSGNMFFITTTLHANPNGIVNDSTYAYKEMVDPFMAHLAEAVARRIWAPEEESTD